MTGALDDERQDGIRARLESIAEEIADLALDQLRVAAAGGDSAEAAQNSERRLTRARRAVEKAASLLEAPS